MLSTNISYETLCNNHFFKISIYIYIHIPYNILSNPFYLLINFLWLTIVILFDCYYLIREAIAISMIRKWYRLLYFLPETFSYRIKVSFHKKKLKETFCFLFCVPISDMMFRKNHFSKIFINVKKFKVGNYKLLCYK